MVYIIIGILVCFITAVFCIIVGDHGDYILLLIIGFISASSCVVLSLYLSFGGWLYTAAKYKAEIINNEYDKNYTQEQVFYANDVIDTIRELDRKRIEANGNIFK